MKYAVCLLVLVAWIAPAHAQRRSESHAPLPFPEPEESWNDVLAKRLREIAADQTIRRLYSNPFVSDAAKRDELLQSPAAAEILARLRNGDPELMELAKQIARNHPEWRRISPELIDSQLPELARQFLTQKSVPNGSAFAPPPPPSLDEQDRLTRQAYSERINDLMRELNLDKVSGSLQHSPAYRDWMKQLSRLGTSFSNGTWRLSPQQLDTLTRWIKGIRARLPEHLPSLDRISLPGNALQNVPRFSFGSPSLPNGISMPRSVEGWSGIAAAVILLIGLVAILRSLRRSSRLVALESALGPWPVDPAAVGTREELIRAFDYLAMLRLGRPAIHWNHRRIAAGLGEAGDRADADVLAGWYEKARYASDPWPEVSAWESGRAALRRLAGIGS